MTLTDAFTPPMAFAALLASPQTPESLPFATARADMEKLLDQAMTKALKKNPDQAVQALFAVCAFADESILTSSWPGRREWMGRKLQQQHFDTGNGGEEFYTRLETLLTEEGADTEEGGLPGGPQHGEQKRDVLEVYLACLHLGFRGCCHDLAGKARIESLIRTLTEKVYGTDPEAGKKAFSGLYDPSCFPPRPSRSGNAIRMAFLFGAPALLTAALLTAFGSLLSAFVGNWLQALSSTL